MISLDEVRCMHMLWCDPFIVTLREPLPLDQVLERSTFPKVAVIDNFFDLLFFFSINQVQWRPREIWSMIDCFTKRGEERCMKDVVNPPVVWEL